MSTADKLAELLHQALAEDCFSGLVVPRVKEALAAYEAEKSRSVDTDVLGICNAYESGYGHWKDDLPNPYRKGSNEHAAYEYGKELGGSKTEKSGNDLSGPFTEREVKLMREAYECGQWNGNFDEWVKDLAAGTADTLDSPKGGE